MSGKFQEQVILITGAASGIGRATTLKLAALGASLALCDVNDSTFSEDQVISFLAAIIEKFGRLDHVFNCAGINPANSPFKDTSLEYFNRQIDVNIKGVFLVTRESLKQLKRGSSIVTVSSMSGTRRTALQGVYNTTKHGVIGMMKSVALEYGPRGIRTNCVAPGYINTPTNSGIVTGGEIVEKWAKACTLERWGTPEDVADVVIFLFSKEARHVSGSVYEVDGAVRW